MARKKLQYDGFVSEPGFEELWQRHIASTIALDRAWDEYTKVGDKIDSAGGDHTHKLWSKFEEAGKAYERAVKSAFGTLDAYQFAVAHKNDKIGVPEEEVRAIVIDSLSDKLDEMEFTLNVGLLGSKVAQAIRKDTSEDSAGDPLYCQDCEQEV